MWSIKLAKVSPTVAMCKTFQRAILPVSIARLILGTKMMQAIILITVIKLIFLTLV